MDSANKLYLKTSGHFVVFLTCLVGGEGRVAIFFFTQLSAEEEMDDRLPESAGPGAGEVWTWIRTHGAGLTFLSSGERGSYAPH